MNIIDVKECSFGYSCQPFVFQNVSFALKPGEVLAIMGCNGTGKSSLLKCIAGILKWKEGTCRIHGETNLNTPKSVGYVAQSKHLSFPFRVRDLVCFGRCVSNPYFAAPSAEDYRITDAVLEELRIAHLSDRLCNQLSGGELQMAFIAKALVSHPKLILLDEPETSLDIKNQLILTDKLTRLAKKYGTTILINSHDLNCMLRIADKCLLLGTSDYLFDSPANLSETDISIFLGVQAKQITSMSDKFFILTAPLQESTLL